MNKSCSPKLLEKLTVKPSQSCEPLAILHGHITAFAFKGQIIENKE